MRERASGRVAVLSKVWSRDLGFVLVGGSNGKGMALALLPVIYFYSKQGNEG